LGSISLATQDPLDLVFPSDEVILEAMTGPNRPWDDLHHRSYFLPKLRRIEAGEFVLTMNGDSPCPINPLATHGVYTKGNMEIIATMIPIDISRTPGIMENVFIREIAPPKRFKFTLSYSRSSMTFFPGLTRRCQASTHELLNMKS
jgi:hypothetical protein